jgi:NADH dehydrogenase FAD-containing subunit
MRVAGLANVFAAGDVALSLVDGVHSTVMSCQFARPMGRFAGHNVVADLFGEPMLPPRIDWYVTVLDLGGWGARSRNFHKWLIEIKSKIIQCQKVEQSAKLCPRGARRGCGRGVERRRRHAAASCVN